ncbi:hypothetical protein [Halalkalirubrum salinum]|uniref:hypothetical protein n=1 Tax=Halalkalirubrum salinum TaxID=2563889 RepID=UPI0010FB5EC7|nr:hypothetical protein [Halalkalirubrum salinum]
MHSQKHRPDGGTPETAATEADPDSEVPADGENPADEPEDDTADSHLTGLTDGVGCTEIWEYLSEQREE